MASCIYRCVLCLCSFVCLFVCFFFFFSVCFLVFGVGRRGLFIGVCYVTQTLKNVVFILFILFYFF